jgi:hypothetical protein
MSRRTVTGWRLIPAVAFALLLAAPVTATILEKVEFDKLCQVSERIVVARCTGDSAAWDDRHQIIQTTWSFTVSQVVKGAATPTVDVVTLGGVVGDQGMNVAGAPSFRKNDEYVLFLERGPANSWRCKGWTQGRYEIAVDPATGLKTVRGDTSGAGLARKGKAAIEEGRPGKPMSLGDFLDSVQTLSAQGGSK